MKYSLGISNFLEEISSLLEEIPSASAAAKSLQLYPTLSLPGSSVHGIFQASVLEWAAIAFSDLNGE